MYSRIQTSSAPLPLILEYSDLKQRRTLERVQKVRTSKCSDLWFVLGPLGQLLRHSFPVKVQIELHEFIIPQGKGDHLIAFVLRVEYGDCIYCTN